MSDYDIFCKYCVKVFQIHSKKNNLPRVPRCPQCHKVARTIIPSVSDIKESDDKTTLQQASNLEVLTRKTCEHAIAEDKPYYKIHRNH